MYKEYHSPLVGIGTLPTPLSPASVPLPPEPKGGGVHSPAGEGLGESQFRRLEKSLALSLLCDYEDFNNEIILTCRLQSFQKRANISKNIVIFHLLCVLELHYSSGFGFQFSQNDQIIVP